MTDRVNREGIPLNQHPFRVPFQKGKESGSWPWNQDCSAWSKLLPHPSLGDEGTFAQVILGKQLRELIPNSIHFPLHASKLGCFILNVVPSGRGRVKVRGSPSLSSSRWSHTPRLDTHKAWVFSISLHSLILPSSCHDVFGKWLHFSSYFLPSKCALT
jgi:hypothetical protein